MNNFSVNAMLTSFFLKAVLIKKRKARKAMRGITLRALYLNDFNLKPEAKSFKPKPFRHP